MARLLMGWGIAVEDDVGVGGRNERGDVAVVQFALLRVQRGDRYKRYLADTEVNLHRSRLRKASIVPNQGKLVVDGIFGRTTEDHIRAFQAYLRTSKGPAELPAPTGLLVNSYKPQSYLDWHVEWLLGQVWGNKSDASHDPREDPLARQLGTDPEAPQFLRNLFYHPWSSNRSPIKKSLL